MIELKCPSCSAQIQANGELDEFYCTHCGARIVMHVNDKNRYKAKVAFKSLDHEAEMKRLDNEQERYRLEFASDEAERKHMREENSSRYWMRMMLLFVGIVFAAYVLISLPASLTGQVQMPQGAKQYAGQNYVYVENAMKDLGFSNVELIAENDLSGNPSLFTPAEGSVDKVTIDGNASFKKDDRFSAKATVRIYYHSYPG